MKKSFDILKKAAIFQNVNEKNIESMLNCLGAYEQNYNKNDILLLAGDTVTSVGIVLCGSAQIVREDIMGNRTIVSEISAGDMFGEAFACANVGKSPVTVLTTTGCSVMFIQFKRIVTTCSSSCSFHTRLIENMLSLIAQKNIFLNNKIDILSQRTIREKVMAYFFMQVQRTGSKKFKIPFTRDELADFLCVNRSALSRELCNMREEKILDFEKNEFKIYIAD
jgi:CRP-like cAMP-binding protein